MKTPIINNLELIAQGKVRDIYSIDKDHLLIVTTDRMSAFDVVLPDLIPGKGEILTQLSHFWFKQTENIVQNHLSDNFTLENIIEDHTNIDYYKTRSMVVKRLKPLPIEAVVRGYLIGSGWKDYQNSGSVCGIALEDNLQMAAPFSKPIYTPATKAEFGEHDENISYEKTIDILGEDLARKVKEHAVAIYNYGVQHASKRGIIIADTKFEFGLDEDGALYLIDEVLTPDSSRFWAMEDYQTGISPPSFDKQYLRDYLETLGWDKTEPGPELSSEIIKNTAAKYQSAYNIITEGTN